MEIWPEFASRQGPSPFRKTGFWAVLIGASALMLVFLQIVGPALEPQPSAASQIGEIAGEIKRSAWWTLLGLWKPQPIVEHTPIWTYLAVAAPMMGAIGLVLSLLSGVRRENWRYAVYGASLSAAAIVFQFVWWMMLLVLGALFLIAVIENIGDIFSF
ncbi:hypothetical protein EOI86_03040 [Hwanghaeella grinnelliae]|uniref:Uncharacterized protein n=1 Tax=Hwanghaeella grinnelliae TaxID=2500179 RepID=A0A3S2Z953_9PROT|nr:hypothetical protein [Hwanghaeella grinnelliae]RVU38284.1 hypothetical protein EOI86_03040 [Hwanghaeella grinnelliae]